jgi:glucosylceramidase
MRAAGRGTSVAVSTAMAFTRRDFLKLSAAAAFAARAPRALAADRTIAVWSTAGKLRHAKLPALSWAATGAAAGNAITVDPAEEYQSILGFGGAFTDSACVNLQRLDPAVRKKLFHQLFHPSELGLSVGRTCIGSSDYAAKLYSFDDGIDPDPQLERFSIDHDREYILPILREARAANPDLWLLASPWSPPGWMKLNNSMLGGTMRRKWLATYASYFDKFLAAYAAERVPINSVTVQNEVDTDQDGRMPACAWPQEVELEFIRDHLGPTLAKSKTPADIWFLDHNYSLWGRALDELADPGALKYIKGVAWHGYVGDAAAMTRVKQAYPTVDAFWTEGGPDFDTPGYETEWAKWGGSFTQILRNWSRCVITWNIALDEKGKPNIGPFNCAGLITVHSKTRAITYSGQFYALQHFSQHLRRGAKVVRSTGEIEGVHHVVARNPDRSYAAVVTNTAAQQRRVQLVVGNSSAAVELAPDSITTLTWS